MTDARIRRPSLINLSREIIEGKLIDTLTRTRSNTRVQSEAC